MGAPTVYRWDDASAPTGGNSTSYTALITILKACLVDGYGSKAAAGWTMPYNNGSDTKACFRNDSVTGTGMYFSVNSSTHASIPYIQGYETMSDFETGLGPFTSVSQRCTSGGSTADARPWMVIADDRCFWWFCWPQNTYALPPTGSQNCQPIFFGDVDSLYDPDPYGCMMISSTTANYTGGPRMGEVTYASTGTSSDFYVARRWATGADVVTGVAHLWGGGTVNTTLGSLGIAGTDPLLISKSMINDAAAYTLRGYVPGMWQTGNIDPFDTLTEVTIDGKDIICINIRNYNYDAYLMVEIGSGFRS